MERPSIDKMTLAEMESVIKADLEKRDKEKQDKYQEPLDSQKEKGKYVCVVLYFVPIVTSPIMCHVVYFIIHNNKYLS